MRLDPIAEARRLLGQFCPSDLRKLAEDPAGTIKALFDVDVTLRPALATASGCTHSPAPVEPLLWIADAVAWAWGRGGRWRVQATELSLLAAVKEVQVS